MNIGNIYSELGGYPKALEYDLKALRIFKELGDKSDEALVTGNIGAVYFEQNNYAEALEYEFKSLAIAEKAANNESAMQAMITIGSVYMAQHHYTDAIRYHFRAFSISKEIDDKNGEAISLCNMADDYIRLAAGSDEEIPYTGPQKKPQLPDNMIPKSKTAQLHKAVGYLTDAITIDEAIGDLNTLEISYQLLSTADSMLGDYKAALLALNRHNGLKDSVYSKNNEKALMRTTMQYEYDKKHLADSLKAAEEIRRQRTYARTGLAGVLMLLGFSFFMIRNNKLLVTEKERSDKLLLNILPSEVAQELKSTGVSTAKHFNNVTVLFTDFVNFTTAGESMSAQNLIEELHACFKAFDEITTRYKIEKIKTIGDAYLAVAGLPAEDHEHAAHVVSAAKEIRQFMISRRERLGDKTFEIRAGIHSGSVVAGIVGVKKFAYDIWGDTVNTAARMEQNSETGKINISQATYELVKDKFTCEYRGEISKE